MRCDLAAALLHNPPILFLDEPTIGLDVVAKDPIRRFLRAINERYQTTILLTTHDLDDIEELCRRIMIIDRGQSSTTVRSRRLKRTICAHQAGEIHLARRRSERPPQLPEKASPPSPPRRRRRRQVASRTRRRNDVPHPLRPRPHLLRPISFARSSPPSRPHLVIEDEPIEEIIKRIYAGEAEMSLCQPEEKNGSPVTT